MFVAKMKKLVTSFSLLFFISLSTIWAQDSLKTRRVFLSGLSCSIGYYHFGDMNNQWDSLRHLLTFNQALSYDSFRLMNSSRAVDKSFSGNQVAFNVDLGLRTKNLKETSHHFQFSAVFMQNLSFTENFYAENRIPKDTFISVNNGELILADSFRQDYQSYSHSFYLWKFNASWLYEFKIQNQISFLIGPSLGFGFSGKRSISAKNDKVFSYSYFNEAGAYLASDTGSSVQSLNENYELKNFSYLSVGVPCQLSIGIGKADASFYNVNLFAEAFFGYSTFFTPDFKKRASDFYSISFGLRMRPSPVVMRVNSNQTFN